MSSSPSKYLSALLLAFLPALLLTACNARPALPTPPEPPTDGWVRDAAPILTAGAWGEDGLQDHSIADPDVLYDPAEGIWHVWYQTARGEKYVSDENVMVIRHAHSTDPGAGWNIDPQPALELPEDPSAWDATHSETPSVVYDPAAPADRRYKMYYSGASRMLDLGFPDYQIGLAVSADGRTFTRLPESESPYGRAGLVVRVEDALADVPGIAGGVVADPEVHLIGGVYHLWFSSFAHDSKNNILAFGISHAVSEDGIHWIPSPGNPIPGLCNSENAGGQQPSVAWNSVRERFEMWFTSDSDNEKEGIPSTFNPALGFWMATSTDGITWTADYGAARDVFWRPDSPEEEYGLLTGAEVVIVDGIRHLFYTGWGSVNVPEGFLVPVRGRRGYVPAVLSLFHAVKDAGE
ncbi:MAG: hypothetical protein WBM17_17070 [Anaerolineales bacterium]